MLALSRCITDLQSHGIHLSFGKNEFNQRPFVPLSRVSCSQRRFRPVSNVIEKPFQRRQSLTKTEPHAAAKAGLVRSAQQPRVVPVECVGAKRRLASIQRHVLYSNDQLGMLPTFNDMHRS